MNRSVLVCSAVLLLIAGASVQAAERYVSDELRVSVRAGKGDDYRITKVLPSGSSVETLESAGDWTRVRTTDGQTGWMRSQYLQDEPIAADRLEQVRAELDTVRTRVEELETALRESRQNVESARQRVAELESRNQTLRDKLSRAEAGLELQQTNERLQARTAKLEERVTTLQQRNQALAERDRQRWFAIGGGVLFGGILLGIIVTRIPRRSRRSRLFE